MRRHYVALLRSTFETRNFVPLYVARDTILICTLDLQHNAAYWYVHWSTMLTSKLNEKLCDFFLLLYNHCYYTIVSYVIQLLSILSIYYL